MVTIDPATDDRRPGAPAPAGAGLCRLCADAARAGALSDALAGSLGISSLRYAMLLAPVAVLGGWAFALLAWRTLHREAAAAPHLN